MTKMEHNENFYVFEMEIMDIMLYKYDINIRGRKLQWNFLCFWNTIQYCNASVALYCIVAHKKKTMWPKYDRRRLHPHRHGRLPWKGCTRTSQRSELHFRGIPHRSVSCCISWRTLQIRLNALLSNTSSILNYSQARIVGLRNTYALSLAATDVVIEMLSDPNFDSRKIHTKYVKRLKKRLLNGFYEEMDGK